MKHEGLSIVVLAAMILVLAVLKHEAHAGNAYDTYYNSIDRSCQVDGDCVIKNIGNCCGGYTECVNVNAVTHPWLVEHYYCRESRIGSICDSQPPSSCRCNKNQCTDLEQIEKESDE